MSPLRTDWQTIHADQAHQWAEVAFEKFGWVTFEPTAPAGAPARTPGFQDGVSSAPEPVLGSEARTVLEAIAADNPDLASAIENRLGTPGQEGSSAADRLEELLANNPSENSLSAAEILVAVGAEVTPLENGGALVSVGTGASWVPGTTTGQASEHPPKPVFQITGGVSTRYLRTTTGRRLFGRSLEPNRSGPICRISREKGYRFWSTAADLTGTCPRFLRLRARQ